MLERAVEVIDRAKVKTVYTVPVLAWAATDCGCKPSTAARSTRDAATGCSAEPPGRLGGRCGRVYHAERCAAGPAGIRRGPGHAGEARRARRMLDKSVAMAKRHQDRYEHAQSRQLRGSSACSAAGRARTRNWRGRGDVARLAMPPASPVAETARPRTGHAVAGGPVRHRARFRPQYRLRTRPRRRVRRSATQRATSVAWRALPTAGNPAGGGPLRITPFDEDRACDYDSAAVERAVRERRAAALNGQTIHDRPPDGSGTHTGSTLCAPILVRGRPVACVYVVHSQVRQLFGSDEERLANFIATMAGAAWRMPRVSSNCRV